MASRSSPPPGKRLQGALDRSDDAAERDLAGKEGVQPPPRWPRFRDRRAAPAGVGRAFGPAGRPESGSRRAGRTRAAPRSSRFRRRHSVAKPVGIAEGDRDRKAHVGAPEPAPFREPSTNSTSEWDRALRVDDHRDVLEAHAEQMVGLDELQALVSSWSPSLRSPFGPIDQRGWFSACSTVIWFEVEVGMGPRNGAAARSDDQPANAIQTFLPTGTARWRCAQSRRARIAAGSRQPSSPSAPRHHQDLLGRKRDFLLRFQRGHRRSQRPALPGMATTTMSHRGSVTIAMTRESKSGSPRLALDGRIRRAGSRSAGPP